MAEPRTADAVAGTTAMVETAIRPRKVPSTMDEYIKAVQRRRAEFHPSDEARTTQRGYVVDPVGAAPHGAPIHAMTMSLDASILLTGGADGYVRWYDLFASLNGKNMLTQNLRNTFVEGVSKGGVLTTWWGHSHWETDEDMQQARDVPYSPVHSLACQRDALWGVSGGEAGHINLWGLRHGPGSTRHVFRQHKGPVSALALDPTETCLLSGGWDRGVHQWDLQTGKIVRSYEGHSGQISDVVFRPTGTPYPSSWASSPEEANDELDVDMSLIKDSSSACGDELEKELKRTLAEETSSDKSDEQDPALASDRDADGEAEGEADNDSLFGDEEDKDGVEDKMHVDEEGEDGDADGDTDMDEPLAKETKAETSADAKLTLPTKPTSTGISLVLPGQRADDAPKAPTASNPTPALKETVTKSLPKPLFGSMNVSWQYDADVSTFSSDVMLTSTLSGQVLLWDRRVDTKNKHGVRALALPQGTPPWCAGVCWNHAGDKIYVGRRNETVEEWDVRMLPDASRPDTVDRSQFGRAPKHVNTLHLPRGSGSVSSVAMMPNNRHIVCGSFDNVRLWDMQASADVDVPFKIVAGHHGGTISQILIDPCARFLLTSSGDRGWFSSSTETLLLHEIMTL